MSSSESLRIQSGFYDPVFSTTGPLDAVQFAEAEDLRMLSEFENLVCHDIDAVPSWQAVADIIR